MGADPSNARLASTALHAAPDLLRLGTHARMSKPGKTDGNWAWRLEPAGLTDDLARRARALSVASKRLDRKDS